MQHHFDVSFAVKYGITEAILMNHFEYWIELNHANGKNFYEGRYWTFNSMKALCEIFPYLTEKKIRNALKNLQELGFLMKGNFNKSSYDRTLWYAFTDLGESMLPKGQMETSKKANGFSEKGEPIPNNNPYNITDDETYKYNTPYNPPEGDGSLYSRMDRDGVLHDEPDFEQTQLEQPVQTVEKPKMKTRKTKKAIVEQEQEEKFTKFWEAWPKKIDKQRAFALWVKENPDDELFNKIMTSLEAQKKQESWNKDGGKYIPNPRNWIEGKRWEDQTSVQVGVSSNVSKPIKELFEQSTSFDWFDE